MEAPDKMGEIKVRTHFKNTIDLLQARENKDHPVPSYDTDAVVDTVAVMLVLPQDAVEHLGLPILRRITVTYANAEKDVRDVAGPVTVEILGRSMEANCVVGPPGTEALVGQIQLEALDLIADSLHRIVYTRDDSPYPTVKM